MATHSSILAWRIPRTAEPGGLLSMGLHRVRHNWSDLAAAAARALAFLVAQLLKNPPAMWETWVRSLGWEVFPDSSVGKESACNAGDPSSIPGLGRSAGEWIDYPLQYSWASLVAQLVKNLPEESSCNAWDLGWEDPLQKGKATHSRILAWRIPWIV